MSFKNSDEPNELAILNANPFRVADDLKNRCYYILHVHQERTSHLSYPGTDDPYFKYFVNFGLQTLPYLLDWLKTKKAASQDLVIMFYRIVGRKGPRKEPGKPQETTQRIIDWATVGSGVPILYAELAKQLDEVGFEYFNLHPAYQRVVAQGPKVARFLKKDFLDYNRPDYQREWRVEAYNEIKASAYKAGFTDLLYVWLSEVIDAQSSWNLYPHLQLPYYRIAEFGERGLQLINMDLRKPLTIYQRAWRERAATEIRISLSGR